MGCSTSSRQFNKASSFEKPVRCVPAIYVAQLSPVAAKPTDSPDFVELFGEQLLTKEGQKPTEEVLGGKSAIGIFFSAHWCPPCPLADMYLKDFRSKGMEIVFVSGDQDVSGFENCYSEMPWAALPYEQKGLQEKLSKKYDVQGIPSLVILGPDGETITTEGRKAVSNDPSGQAWIPPTATEKAKIVVDALGADVMEKSQGKSIGLLFSAYWCPPCRDFTSKLAEFYIDGLKDKMEIVFVSSDVDQASFNQFFNEMPWLAMPFEKCAEKAALLDAFGVSGVPSLVVLNADGTLITTKGRRHVMADPKGEQFPASWQ